MKRLIVCCDGTWNSADQTENGAPCPTNVVKFVNRIAKFDSSNGERILQIVYYDQGVGTGNFFDRLTGGAFGDGLEANIHDAYRFLVGNYEKGDEVFLFGFSRGAFTARSIGGMIRKCGILKRDCARKYPVAIALYNDQPHTEISAQIPPEKGFHPDDAFPCEFRKNHSVHAADPVDIRCVGVWDTVGSLGIPLRGFRSFTQKKYQFHDTKLNGWVKYGFHALAIDEHRAPFEPTLWSNPSPHQTLRQVWFAGAHSDVGGGYPESELSNIALQWMVDQLKQEKLLAFDPQVEAAYEIKSDPLGMLHDSKTGVYNLTVGIDRKVTPDKEGQSIHPSVKERWDRDSKYRPDSLKEIWKE